MPDQQDTLRGYTDDAISLIHHSLRASRRRLVVVLIARRHLDATSCGTDEPTASGQQPDAEIDVSVRLLAREIVSIERDIPIERATGDAYHSVYTSLIQSHLPELDDIAAVQYDADRKTVGPDRNLTALAVVATVSSPVAHVFFQRGVVDHDFGGTLSVDGATDD